MLKLRVPKFFKSVKYLLAATTGLLLLTGVFFIITGVLVLTKIASYDDLITNNYRHVPAYVTATGVIICFTCLLGFYSALTEQFYAVAAFTGMLILVLVLEIAMIIAGFGLYNASSTNLASKMAQHRLQYGTRIEVTQIWDNLQREFECCGVSGRNDWGSNYPVSCCYIDYGTISPFTCNLANSYSTGCSSVLSAWLSQNVHVIAIGATVVTSLQLLITAVSGWIAWRVKYDVVELES